MKNRMKRFWLILAVLSLTLVLCACGDDGGSGEKAEKTKKEETKKEETSSKKSKDKEADNVKDKDEASEEEIAPVDKDAQTYWPLTAVDPADVKIPMYKVQEVQVINSDIKVQLLQTSICEPKEEVLEALRQDSWLNSLGQVVDCKYETATNFMNADIGDIWGYQSVDGISFIEKKNGTSDDMVRDDTSRFSLRYCYDTGKAINETEVELVFYNLDFRDGKIITEMNRIAQMVYGKDLGNVLMNYATDETLNDPKKVNNLQIIRKEKDANIYVNRYFSGENDSVMHLKVVIDSQLSNKVTVGLDYDPVFPSFELTLDKVFEGDFGETDVINHVREFGNKYYANIPDYTVALPTLYGTMYSMRSYTMEDGCVRYDVEYEYGRPAELKIEYKIYKTGEEYDYVNCKVVADAVDLGGELFENYEKQLTLMNSQFESLFGINPGITFDQLEKISEEKMEGVFPVTVNFAGMEFETQYKITMTKRFSGLAQGQWEVSFGYWKPLE